MVSSYTKDPGGNNLYIRLYLRGCSGVALLGNGPTIPGATRLAATAQIHPRCDKIISARVLA